jgi:CHAT domain-containing protein
VVSLWAVSDESTALLMKQFYEALQSGYCVAESLRCAQLGLMDRSPHPYYWASFNVTGDGQVTLGGPSSQLSRL